MPEKISAGLMMYRIREGQLEVLIAHPGGPFCRHRDRDCWTIPKGEVEAGESLLDAARREFQEEVGIVPAGPFIDLGWIRQKSGKKVYAWAFHRDRLPAALLSTSTFELEWPPGSGRLSQFPEVDRAEFFPVDACRFRLKNAQHPFLDRLACRLRESTPAPSSAGVTTQEESP